MFLHVVLAYLMLSTALFNAICLCNAFYFIFYLALDFSIVIYTSTFCFNSLTLGY